MSPQRFGLLLEPADVLMLRESRPFGEGSRPSRSELPTPRVTAGAIRTWLLEGLGADLSPLRRAPWRGRLRNGELTLPRALAECLGSQSGSAAFSWALAARFFGPLLADQGSCLLPLPQHLVEPEASPGGGSGGEEEHEAWAPETLEKVGPGAGGGSAVQLDGARLWREGPRSWVSSWEAHALLGSHSTYPRANLVREPRLVGREPRVGLERAPGTRVAEEGRLYQQSFLRLRRRVVLRVDVEAESDAVDRVKVLARRRPYLRLGGEGRVAGVRVAAAPLPIADWCAGGWPPENGRFLTCLATPAFWPRGEPPQELSDRFELVAAVTGSPVPISGWNSALALPARTRYALPAGSVHFWKVKDISNPGPDPHGGLFGEGDPSAAEADPLAGWGLLLRGVWPARAAAAAILPGGISS